MFQTGLQILNDYKPQSWLIKGIIPEGKNLIQLFGQSNTGKSFVALDWALTIATGRGEWNGCKAKEGKVLYLYGEGASGMGKRIKAWIQEKGCPEDAERLNTNFATLNNSDILFDGPEGSLFTKGLDTIRKEGFKPDLIIVDTLNRFFNGNENGSEDARRFVACCDRLSNENFCPTLWVHHVGWSESAKDRGRGSSVFFTDIDFQYGLEQNAEGVVTLTQSKNKDGEKNVKKSFRLRPVDLTGLADEDGDPVTSCVLEPCDPPEPVAVLTERRIADIKYAKAAFLEHGYLEHGAVCLDRYNFKAFMRGKLTDKSGKPLTEDAFTLQFNPNQHGRFISRLVDTNTIEVVENGSKYRAIDPDIVESVVDRRNTPATLPEL